jgi:hypothetical protein
MTTNISPELFLAILSMDAYNRGYDAGIGLGRAARHRVNFPVTEYSSSCRIFR